MAAHNYIAPYEAVKFIGTGFQLSSKLFHADVQSARNETTSLEALFSKLNVQFNVLMLPETWYHTTDDPYCSPEYNSCVFIRESGSGGVVLMLIRKDIKFEPVSLFTRSSRDHGVLSVLSNRKLVRVYRPPAGNFDIFLNFLESLFLYKDDNRLSLICGGDFIINLLDSSGPAKQFKLMLRM